MHVGQDRSYTSFPHTCFNKWINNGVRRPHQIRGPRATKGTVLTSQSLSPWCDCRRLGSTLGSWRWQDINVGNPLWRRALLAKAVMPNPKITSFFNHKEGRTDHYGPDLPSPASLPAEVRLWRRKWECTEETSKPVTLQQTLAATSRALHLNIYRIFPLPILISVTRVQGWRGPTRPWSLWRRWWGAPWASIGSMASSSYPCTRTLSSTMDRS